MKGKERKEKEKEKKEEEDMEVMDAFLEGVEETIETVVCEENTKNDMEIFSNDCEAEGKQHDNMEVTNAFLEGVEETTETAIVVEEEEINENMDAFVETEEDDANAQESEIENDINTNVSSKNETYTMMEVLIPSSSDKQTHKRNTPSRPLCAADVDNHVLQSQPQEQQQQQDKEQNVFLAIEQEAMGEDDEDEDKENIEQQEQEQEEETEVPMLTVKTIKSSSSTSSGPAVKRLSSLYLPTKSTLARVRDAEAHEAPTARPTNPHTNPFSGSQSLKSAMSNTGRSVASVASSASMGGGQHSNYARSGSGSASYKSPQARGMCKGAKHNNNINKGFKKPSQPQATVAVRRGPTIPVTPHFRSDARSKMHYKERPLTTEEREMAAIEIARKMEELRMKKTKKVCLCCVRLCCVYVCLYVCIYTFV